MRHKGKSKKKKKDSLFNFVIISECLEPRNVVLYPNLPKNESYYNYVFCINTVNVLKFRTLDAWPKAQTQKKQSDQGLLCLLFRPVFW